MAEKSVPRDHFSDAHKWKTIHILQKQLSICTHTAVITILQAWAVRAELQYSVKIEIQKRLALFRNPQSFVDCSMEKSKRYNFFWLIWRTFNISSHLIIVSIYISRAVFPILTVHHSLRTNPYKMSIFQRSVTCSFFRNRAHILTRTQGKKFQDMFLIKIASKGTSLNLPHQYLADNKLQHSFIILANFE